MNARFIFLGDICLNNGYEKIYSEGKNPFQKIAPHLLQGDFVVGNLECITYGDQGENELKKPRLGTSAETLSLLQHLNLNMVTLAHNHIYDHLESGFQKTIKSLKEMSIAHMGASLHKNQESAPFVMSLKGIRFGILNYITPDTNPSLPKTAQLFVNLFNIENAVSDIEKLNNECDHLIILMHWGGDTEKGYFPDLKQPNIARRLIDAGADIIIGHHSHTLQPYEVYKGKYIFYSLGNFCFDDILFDNEVYFRLNQRQKKSLIVTVDFFKTGYQVNYVPIYNRNLYLEYKKRLIYTLTIRNYLLQIMRRIPVLWDSYFFQMRRINNFLYFFFIKDVSLITKISTIKNRIMNFFKY